MVDLHLEDKVPLDGVYQVLPGQQRLVIRAHTQSELVLVLAQSAQCQPTEVNGAVHGRLGFGSPGGRCSALLVNIHCAISCVGILLSGSLVQLILVQLLLAK